MASQRDGWHAGPRVPCRPGSNPGANLKSIEVETEIAFCLYLGSAGVPRSQENAHPLGQSWGPMRGATVCSYGGAVSYERGTPAGSRQLCKRTNQLLAAWKPPPREPGHASACISARVERCSAREICWGGVEKSRNQWRKGDGALRVALTSRGRPSRCPSARSFEVHCRMLS